MTVEMALALQQAQRMFLLERALCCTTALYSATTGQVFHRLMNIILYMYNEYITKAYEDVRYY